MWLPLSPAGFQAAEVVGLGAHVGVGGRSQAGKNAALAQPAMLHRKEIIFFPFFFFKASF